MLVRVADNRWPLHRLLLHIPDAEFGAHQAKRPCGRAKGRENDRSAQGRAGQADRQASAAGWPHRLGGPNPEPGGPIAGKHSSREARPAGSGGSIRRQARPEQHQEMARALRQQGRCGHDLLHPGGGNSLRKVTCL